MIALTKEIYTYANGNIYITHLYYIFKIFINSIIYSVNVSTSLIWSHGCYPSLLQANNQNYMFIIKIFITTYLMDIFIYQKYGSLLLSDSSNLNDTYFSMRHIFYIHDGYIFYMICVLLIFMISNH